MRINGSYESLNNHRDYYGGKRFALNPNLAARRAWTPLRRCSSSTAANATAPDPANPLVTINVGQTQTKRLELDLTGRILPDCQASGGYTYQDAKLRGNGSVRLGQVPKHELALWNRYDFSDRFGVGLGVVRQSSQFAAMRTAPTTTRLPAFTRVDAALFFKINETVQLQANIESRLNTDYFPTRKTTIILPRARRSTDG